jgi:hypothetical protein
MCRTCTCTCWGGGLAEPRRGAAAHRCRPLPQSLTFGKTNLRSGRPQSAVEAPRLTNPTRCTALDSVRLAAEPPPGRRVAVACPAHDRCYPRRRRRRLVPHRQEWRRSSPGRAAVPCRTRWLRAIVPAASPAGAEGRAPGLSGGGQKRAQDLLPSTVRAGGRMGEGSVREADRETASGLLPGSAVRELMSRTARPPTGEG